MRGRPKSVQPYPLPSVVTGAKNINTDYGCGRATGPDMTLGSRPSPNNTMALDVKQTIHHSLLLSIFISLDLPLSTGHEPFCISVFSSPTTYLPSIIVANQCFLKAGSCFLLLASGEESSGQAWRALCLAQLYPTVLF